MFSGWTAGDFGTGGLANFFDWGIVFGDDKFAGVHVPSRFARIITEARVGSGLGGGVPSSKSWKRKKKMFRNHKYINIKYKIFSLENSKVKLFIFNFFQQNYLNDLNKNISFLEYRLLGRRMKVVKTDSEKTFLVVVVVFSQT